MAKVVSLLPEFLDQSGDPDPEPELNGNGGPTTFNAIIVTESVGGVNGTYVLDGQENGKDKYVFDGTTIKWTGSAWIFINLIVGTVYSSSEDVEFPWEVEVWEDLATFGVTPTLTPTNV